MSKLLAIAPLSAADLTYEALFAASPAGLAIIDRSTCIVLANDRYAALFNLTASSLIGQRIRDLDATGGSNIQRDFTVFDAGCSVPDHEFTLDGQTYHVSVAPLRDNAGHVIAIQAALIDISDEVRIGRELADANSQLQKLARQDHLTGLYNRGYFEDAITREFKRLQRDNGVMSIVLIDVDHFKLFNDLYGHISGDNCLRAVAAAAKGALLRPGDYLSRYGGEELVAILADTDAEGAILTAERMRAAVEALAIPHARSAFGTVTISLGVATTDGQTGKSVQHKRDQLVGAADRALYLAKARGRNQIASSADLETALPPFAGLVQTSG